MRRPFFVYNPGARPSRPQGLSSDGRLRVGEDAGMLECRSARDGRAPTPHSGLSNRINSNQYSRSQKLPIYMKTNCHFNRIGLPSFISLLTLFAALAVGSAASGAAVESEQRLSLDRAWRFYQGDIPFPVVTGHNMTYNSAKAGKAWGAAAPEFDDSDWRLVDLPHDWAVEGPFDPKANVSQGYRPRGIGWYRRYLRLDPSERGNSFELQFDGIATHCEVWLNGTVVHRNWCGYTGFTVDLTPFASYGDQLNTIVIRVDADAQEGWWYEGAGLYRHTWLVKRNPLHLATDGIHADPIRKSDGKWEIPVEATIQNDGKSPVSLEMSVELLDPEGKSVGQSSTRADSVPLNDAVARLSIPVLSPRLWSLETSTLYTLRTTLKSDGATVDQRTTRCGFRTIRFDADKGFFLNDQPVKLKGTCNHQDHAGVGVAVPDSLWEFRVRRLKAMGSNAYRCAHNPPAPEFLEACDRLGMLVMDENRNFNVSPEYVRQLEWMVRRDRNHPSVILWSVFNEETTQGTEMGYEMVRRMSAVVKRLDTTRPITAAMSGGISSPINVAQAVDVVGFNYQQGAYDGFHKSHPNQPLTSSEDTSAYMTRGVYEEVKGVSMASSYDLVAAPWGATHRRAWKTIADRPYLAGGFVWTGFDYRGEPQKFSWPSVSSVFGSMDTCGFPKAAYYMHQAAWIEDRPVLSLIPHWNWKGREGQPIKVLALSNVEKVELFLNGKSLGEKSIDKLVGGEWQVPYEAGRLEAVGKRDGKEIVRTAVETTGDPVAIQLTPDRSSLDGNGADAMPVTVSAVDAQGREVPTANLPITFELSGPGAILGHGNGDNTSHEPEQGNQRSLFNGLAQLIVQSQRDSAGTVVIKASSPSMRTAEAQIEIRKTAPIPAVPPTASIHTLAKWRLSPLSAEKPDPNQKIADTDMNTWANVQAGTPQKFEGGKWATYRVTFSPSAGIQKKGGTILFKEISGTAEVWVDQVLAAEKKKSAPAELQVKLPAGTSHTISVLVNSGGAAKAGLSGVVVVSEF